MPTGCTRLTTSRKLAEKQGIFLLLLFFNRRQGIISTGNIDTFQKYDWSTLRKKTGKIEVFHNLLYSKADKTLLLNDLKTNTTIFPVAIRNDDENICIGFIEEIHRARSLRNAKNSFDAATEKQIVAIFGKKNGEEKFAEMVYQKEGHKQ